MNVSCTKCRKEYKLPDAMVVPGMQIRMRCKACQTEFDVAIPATVPAAAAPDPLAGVADAAHARPSDPEAPVGEVTRHFINQSGANRRNPWWKKALFVVGVVGGPVAILFVLSTMRVVTVTRTNENGEAVQESFFSANGVSGLKDLLTGAEADRRAAAEAKKVEKARQVARERSPTEGAKTGGLGLDSPDRKGSATGTAQSGDLALPSGGLAGFYGNTEGRTDVAPKIRGADAPAAAHTGGLDDDAAAKVVASSQPAFQSCIEAALRRTPNMKVGKVVLTVTVARSGVVKGATIAPKQHETSEWGGCLAQRARRMVFPPFEGDDEAEVQVPLVVGVSM